MAEVKKEKPRYYAASGKLYDAGVEISDKEAAKILSGNAERRLKNAAATKTAQEDKSDMGKMMAKVNQYANEVFDREDAELNSALASRKAPSVKK